MFVEEEGQAEFGLVEIERVFAEEDGQLQVLVGKLELGLVEIGRVFAEKDGQVEAC